MAHDVRCVCLSLCACPCVSAAGLKTTPSSDSSATVSVPEGNQNDGYPAQPTRHPAVGLDTGSPSCENPVLKSTTTARVTRQIYQQLSWIPEADSSLTL